MKLFIRNSKGFAVVLAYLVSVVCVIIGIGLTCRMIFERRNTARQVERTQAFYLAEAAVDRALAKLPGDTSNEGPTSEIEEQFQGQYQLVIDTVTANQLWRATGYGYVPSKAAAREVSIVQAMVAQQPPPEEFYDNLFYTAGNITIKGNNYETTGEYRYAGILDVQHPAGHLQTDPPTPMDDYEEHDPTCSPLWQLDFVALRALAEAQGHVYSEGFDVDDLPDSFWWEAPSPSNPFGTPNYVYIETDLILNGNIGTIGGFFIVVGDVINDPNDIAGTVINGNGTIEGCVYTSGQFRVNGGGGADLNIHGGVWSGQDGIRVNGSVVATYFPDYMAAIEANMPPPAVQILGWREIRPGEDGFAIPP